MDSEWSIVKQYLYVSFRAVSFNASDNSFSMQIAEGEALGKAGVQKEVDGRRKEGSTWGTRYPVTSYLINQTLRSRIFS